MPTRPKRPVLPTVEGIPSLVSAFSEEKYRNGITTLKYNKAAGIDDVLVEQLKILGHRVHKWLLTMLSKCLTENKIPKFWRQSKIIAILKPGKYSVIAKSYRPISLLYHTYKLYERMILNRVTPLLEIVPNDTACANCVEPSRPQQWGPDLCFFGKSVMRTRWMAGVASDICYICDICYKQIHVRKQISIRCNRIEHWVHLRCAGIRQAQYTNTWTCHLHRESRLAPHNRHNTTPPLQTLDQALYPLPTYITLTTATKTQTHVQHSPCSHRIGKVQTQSSHPLTPSPPTPPRAKHISHTPPTPHIPRTTLIHNRSAALGTIPEPRVPPTCPALTTPHTSPIPALP